jgi:hypothetical protein
MAVSFKFGEVSRFGVISSNLGYVRSFLVTNTKSHFLNLPCAAKDRPRTPKHCVITKGRGHNEPSKRHELRSSKWHVLFGSDPQALGIM